MPSTPSGTWAVDELEKRLPEDDIKTYGDFRAVTKLDAGIERICPLVEEAGPNFRRVKWSV
jgi:hypothetical protein